MNLIDLADIHAAARGEDGIPSYLADPVVRALVEVKVGPVALPAPFPQWRQRHHEAMTEPRTWADRLSTKHRDVLLLLLDGLGNKQVAAQLGVSLRTVEERRAELIRAAGVDSFAGLVIASVRAGLVA